jgi:signal recognition particle receptor subunit beta
LKRFIDFEECHAIIYVLDSNDADRFSEARVELRRLLDNEHLRNVPLLVFSTKHDLPHNAMNAQAIADQLRLNEIQDRAWHIQVCQAPTEEGIREGLRWLMAILKLEE